MDSFGVLFSLEQQQNGSRGASPSTRFAKAPPEAEDRGPLQLTSAQRRLAHRLLPTRRYAGVTWLEPRRELIRPLRYLPWLVLFPSCALLTALHFMLLPMASEANDPEIIDRLRYAIYGLATVGAALALAGWGVLDLFRNRIGVKGSLLYLRDSRGYTVELPPELAVSTSDLIAFGPIAVPLKLGKNLFSDSDFSQYIFPLLQRAQRVSRIQMALYRIRERQWLALLNLVVVVILLAVTGFTLILFD